VTNTRLMTILDDQKARTHGSLKRQSQIRPHGSNSAGSPTLIRLLAESALHRAIFDACSIPIALVDLRAVDHPIALVNPAFEAYFGYASREVEKRPLIDLLCGRGSEAARRLLAIPASRVVLDAACRDGSTLRCEVTAGHVRGGDGELSYAVLAFSAKAEQRVAAPQLDLLNLTPA
jgi:PAS domain S-box-containing protein